MERLLLLRHGETVGDSSVRYWGRTDMPLSPLGRSQARAAIRLLQDEPITSLVTSRLSRARECGQLALGGRDLPCHAESVLDEVHFGWWEGWTRDEISSRDPQRFRQWQVDPEEFRFPRGESLGEFRRRIRGGLRRFDSREFGDCPLVAAHRGVIRHLLCGLLGSDRPEHRYHVDLGSLTVVRREPDGWRLESFNRTDHLP